MPCKTIPKTDRRSRLVSFLFGLGVFLRMRKMMTEDNHDNMTTAKTSVGQNSRRIIGRILPEVIWYIASMFWAWISIAGYALFAALAFGLRSFVQYRRTGSSGFHVAKAQGMARFAALLIGAAKVAWLMAPVSILLGWLSLISAMDNRELHIAGIAAAVFGMIVTVYGQFAMGDSWRVGIDSTQRTALVTDGPFRWVRNPIYDGLLIFAAGIVLIIPTWLALISFGMLIVSIEVQVRCVEEPYMLGMHGQSYRSWAARTGRFIPFVGRRW